MINIGVAGGNPKSSKIGQCYLANKIVDAETNESHVIDIPIEHNLEEKSLVTVMKCVTNGVDSHLELVDMEASAICAVSQKYIPIERLAVLKVVSDYMDLRNANFPFDIVTDLIENNLSIINKFLLDFRSIMELNDNVKRVLN